MIDRIAMLNAAIPTELEICDGDLRPDGSVEQRLVVSVHVPERDTGEPWTVRHSYPIPPGADLVPFARNCIARAWLHELD